jgi:hypothetical protein
MAFSLTWLPTVLLDAGLRVAEQPGWRTRGRGDVGTIRGVMCHHAAGLRTGNTGHTSGPLADLWPAIQLDAYRRGCAAVLKAIGANAIMCCGHKEYALPPRPQPDPTFDMDEFRLHVAAIIAGAAPSPSVTPPVDVTRELR